MTRWRVAVAGTVAALAATVLTLGGVLGEEPDAAPRAAERPIALEADPTARTKALVRSLQDRARANAQDAEALAQLGLAYEQRARETGDSAYLAKADGVLRRSLHLRPRSAVALTGLGSLALSRHDFRQAVALGRRALALAPGDAAARAVVGDALVELGRYEQAFRVFDRLAAEDPGPASYARVSYGRELLGRIDAAVDAMELAAAGTSSEAGAWARVQLAKLELGRGRRAAAAAQLRTALALFPGYPAALDALAHVEAAQGRLGRAITLARRAVAASPSPQFAATLADLYVVAGDRRALREQYALVDALASLLRANGVSADLELAQFDADHGRRPARAVRLARSAFAAAPSVEAADVLAWALARAGRCSEALPFSDRALRLGGDARKLFHRGMIERCLGGDEAGRRWFRRALARNPHFSIRWAAVAREYAR